MVGTNGMITKYYRLLYQRLSKEQSEMKRPSMYYQTIDPIELGWMALYLCILRPKYNANQAMKVMGVSPVLNKVKE